MNSLQYTISEEHVDYSKNSDRFYEIFHSVLNNHAHRRKKYICGNNKTFMTKTYSRAIMQRTRFRNKFFKNPTEENKLHYNKQRNFCVSLLRKEKKEYFAKINEKDMTHKMKFWQTVKPFLSYKVKSKEPNILVENDKKSLIKLKLQKLSMNFSEILTKILKLRNINVKTSYTVDC